MATGAAASQAAQRDTSKQQAQATDKGPGSLAGNLTKDPELRYTGTGRPVCNLRIASSERVRNEQTGAWEDGPTVFYDVQAWGNLAENVTEHLQRGDRIVAEGRWMESDYTNDQAVTVTRTYLQVRDLGPSMIFRGARPVRKESR